MFKWVAYLFMNLCLLAIICWLLLYLETYINSLIAGNNLTFHALLLLAEAVILTALIYALNRWFVTIITAMKNEAGIALGTAIVELLISICFINFLLTQI